MAQASCFQEMFANFIKKLKELDKVKEVSSHFSPEHSLEDMFSYLWGLDEAHTYLRPSLTDTSKSDAESERLRAEGNRFYQKKILDKALKLYNLSIMSAPHPTLSQMNRNSQADPNYDNSNNIKTLPMPEGFDKSNEDTYRSLALGYANRSAVLFELEQYEKCINDIDMALEHGYPKLLHSKLAERKAKCLISQRKETEAKQLLQSSLQALNVISLDETKTKASRDALHQLLQKCEEVGPANSPSEPDCTNMPSYLSSATKEKLLFTYKTPKPPELLHPNPTIPSMASAVRLAFSPMQGRYLVAERDISPGEVLVVEEGYSRVLHLDSSLRTHCSGCLARCLTPLPCPSCSKVVFCSSACRIRGLASYHGRECCTISALAALDMGKNSVLAYRLVIQTSYIYLQDTVPILLSEAWQCAPETLGFNDSGIYDSSDYRTIYHLVTNKKSRSVSDLFKRCAMALILTKLLQESRTFFVNAMGEPFVPTHNDILLTGCTLFVHMMNLPCNAHSITSLQVDVSNYHRSSSQEIGCGAFGVLSLTNHSCNPAAARSSYGSVVVLRAIRFISHGEEVTDCYGEHYGIKSAESRMATLMQQYYFHCSCDPCKYNWPTYLSLTSKLKLKCLKCSKAINCDKQECTKCKLKYNESAGNDLGTGVGSYYCTDIDKQIKQAVINYDDAYKSIIEGTNSTENFNIVCEIIKLIDKYVEQPNKVYFEAQETLKHCLDRQGSCVFKKE
ncbi:LOW QUALITY PROTEIN: SET and MYND domain-containing protein 4 [Procambarus clarkii]|uniref:LOW QUALITY PROTEIN: SET and MYND domain-containing protein 4 n=1 Tax=Procambarus clarkii TaxID=6728 RepID=UPI003743F65D